MSIRGIAVAAAAAVTALGAVGAPAALAGTAHQFTGAQLAHALVPASAFPAGYKVADVKNSGKRLETGPARFHIATMSCASFGRNFGNAGFGESAFARDGVNQAGGKRGYGQEIYQFRSSGAAAAFFGNIRAIAHRCPAFAFSGTPIKVTTHAFDGKAIGGHRTFQVNQSGSVGGQKIAVDFVFTVSGPDLFFAGTSGVNAAPPSSPSARTVIAKLINRVRALR